MKKILTAMMIMVIAATAVFAQSTSVNLTYAVTDTWTPGYALYYVSNNATFASNALAGMTIDGALNENQTNTVVMKTAEDGATNFVDGYVAVAIMDNSAFNLTEAKSVTYTAKVTQSWQKAGTPVVNGPAVKITELSSTDHTGITVTPFTTTANEEEGITVVYSANTPHATATEQEIARFAAYWTVGTAQYQTGDYTAIVTISTTAV